MLRFTFENLQFQRNVLSSLNFQTIFKFLEDQNATYILMFVCFFLKKKFYQDIIHDCKIHLLKCTMVSSRLHKVVQPSPLS